MYRQLIPYEDVVLSVEIVGKFVRLESTLDETIAGTVTHRSGCDIYVDEVSGGTNSICLQYGDTYVTTIDDYIDPTVEPSLTYFLAQVEE